MDLGEGAKGIEEGEKGERAKRRRVKKNLFAFYPFTLFPFSPLCVPRPSPQKPKKGRGSAPLIFGFWLL
ncbi:MAG: hypothetical protein A2Y80_06255 [Deltaproteobacteria bacterium RBG_13_58_19]|nr:MAG: hypothetical protein A2Y80_06255 [Deltaproteobacteria bacterium RBG_13_58_19]